jgi:hypothetical protein
MAETGKKAAEGSASPTNDPAPDIARRENETVNTPDESKNASVKVSTVFPYGSFTVEGVPVITREGTMLTKTQYAQAQKAAEASGLTLREVK